MRLPIAAITLASVFAVSAGVIYYVHQDHTETRLVRENERILLKPLFAYLGLEFANTTINTL